MPARHETAAMPHLNLQISGPADSELARRASAAIADLTVEVLGKRRELIAIEVRFVERAHWFVGGRSLDELGRNSFFLDISITDETNTKDEKARFIEQAYARLSALIGEVHEVSYIHVVDARAAAYGYGGATQEHRYQAARIAAPG
ncbi:4-oxalocrotonate tautomerase [Lysobacter enzymogenes]|nr:4-oxalocrotonate tautomerase [Lysobacter enzymogenes]